MKQINTTLSLLFLSFASFASADEASKKATPEPSIGLSTTELLIVALLLFAVVLLFVSVMLFRVFKVMYKEKLNPTPYVKYIPEEAVDYDTWLKQQKTQPNIWTKLLSLKPIEEEKDMVIPHAYDGINELNNPVPAWFNFLFYGTMIFAAGYLYYYHIGEYGERQDQEYETELVKAAEAKRKFLAGSAASIDENSVKIDPSFVANGKIVYSTNCAACHGQNGEGLVGPNLTDEFWLHGGGINHIFKTIKYGVPEKGMVSWEKNLTSKNISEVANYILTLKGTNPANAKAPQGEKYEEETSAQDTVKNETAKAN